MKTTLKLAAAVALSFGCLSVYAQEGDKMMKKEGKMDHKQMKENHKMMHDGKAKKEDKVMKSKLKDGKKMESKEKSM
jgi:hypothetical protein